MNDFKRFWQRRVTLAIVGAVLIGGGSAAIAAFAVTPHLANMSPTTSADSTNGSSPTLGPSATVTFALTATASVSSPSTGGQTSTPTTATPVTSTSTTTATATISTKPTTLNGTINTVNSTNQSLTLNGSSVTILTNGATQYQGVNGFANLRGGQNVSIQGQYQSQKVFLATQIQVHQDN